MCGVIQHYGYISNIIPVALRIQLSWSCKAWFAHPCQWDAELQKWPLLLLSKFEESFIKKSGPPSECFFVRVFTVAAIWLITCLPLKFNTNQLTYLNKRGKKQVTRCAIQPLYSVTGLSVFVSFSAANSPSNLKQDGCFFIVTFKACKIRTEHPVPSWWQKTDLLSSEFLLLPLLSNQHHWLVNLSLLGGLH